MICHFFEIQAKQRRVHALSATTKKEDGWYVLACPQSQALYLKKRETLIDRVFSLGEKFHQHRETIHIAVELFDQFYLAMSQVTPIESYRANYLNQRDVILH